MAEIIWSEPALSDLDAIVDYIALENRVAASELVKRIFGHVEQLADAVAEGARAGVEKPLLVSSRQAACRRAGAARPHSDPACR